jgi:putative nucleotidyltransferase with HDIG domain
MKSIVVPKIYKQVIDKIVVTAKENNFDVYIVGGFVRDLLIGRQPKDLDIMVCAKKDYVDGRLAGINFSKILANKYNLCKPVIFERFGTSKLFIDDKEVEFVAPRKEYYDSNSRNPTTQIAPLDQDALRRDFTINALFLRLSDRKIIDLTKQGLTDIQNKIIRVTDTSCAEIIFKQDPLRILRALRQSLQLGFSIDSKTYNAMRSCAVRIKIVACERLRDELNKILVEKNPSRAFVMMDNINLLVEILPEVSRLKNLEQPLGYCIDDVFTHTLKVLDRTRGDIVLRMAALLHDTGKYQTHKKDGNKISFYEHNIAGAKETESILKRLKYSKEFIDKTVSIVKNHMYPKMYAITWSDTAIRRFVKRCGNELDAIMEFSKADCNQDGGYKKLIELNNRIEDLKSKNMLYINPRLLSGKELMKAFNKPAGKWIQEAKSKIEEMQIKNPAIAQEDIFEAIKNEVNEVKAKKDANSPKEKDKFQVSSQINNEEPIAQIDAINFDKIKKEKIERTYDVKAMFIGGVAGFVIGTIISFNIIFAIEIGVFIGLIVGTILKSKKNTPLA